LNCVLTEIYEQEPVLSNFNASDYQRHLAEFRKLEKDVFRTNQYRVLAEVYPYYKVCCRQRGASEKALIRESQKVKRHIPIRRLVTENAEYLLNYKPCWMMSPLTLSSYIPYGSVEFDVVIFDEASQMKIENALGSIARAKQVVVIGDENQLPPTSFFESASDDEEEDEEELEDVGYESLLQASIATLPGLQPELLYHYRSTSDNLIAFSNHHIYGNRLITFPSPKNIDDSVKFEYVHNGVYDSGKTRRNRIEAERVADLCIEHVKNSSDSLGVIAFSKAQEEVIREVLNERIKDEPFLAEKLDEMNPVKESFFVKNLESVQGDERDTIILSVGYGPDHLGNVYNRFGPINKKGGHRRLNVAVTRAKNKIICVSSMKFFQMNPGESAKGAILLQRYLEYAESGRSVLDASKIPTQNLVEADSDFELSVQEALENIGYSVHRQIGASGFKIDLAVLHPENGNAYVLGIECDGAIYHSSKSARMRDRFRQDILERLDWQIYRVWSQHWLIHKQEILDDIVRIINKNV
jgi:superfamily I DNA and/or RNA helicase/very-short-patch-repair endonuclease